MNRNENESPQILTNAQEAQGEKILANINQGISDADESFSKKFDDEGVRLLELVNATE